MYVARLGQCLIQDKHSMIQQQALNEHFYVPGIMKNSKYIINHHVRDVIFVYILEISELGHKNIKSSQHATASEQQSWFRIKQSFPESTC